MMSQAPTTVPRKQSMLWSTVQVVLFVPLYAAGLSIALLLSFGLFSISVNSDTINVALIELHWYRHFPQFQGYAGELLKRDFIGPILVFILGVLPSIIGPSILIYGGWLCIKKRTINIVLNPVFCWLYSTWLLISVFIIYSSLV